MLENREGQPVPAVTLKARQNDDWLDINTGDLFKDKTIAVFSLPGAFTPTCSSSHVPRYNELASAFKDNGVDAVYCVSVNDGFVMEAWQQDQKAFNIGMLPDGNGEFTEGMGMLVDKNDIGFGKRSWRYSMLVKNGVVEKMFIEPDEPGDPFKVSDADTLLQYINSDAKEPEFVTLFSRQGCPHCARAKSLLQEKGLEYEEILTGDTITSRSVRAATGRSTVPQVFIGGKHIGGADDLESYLQQ